MVLEQIFKCPLKLNKIRTGPLAKHMEDFCQWLIVKGFSRYSIGNHLSNVSHLNAYLHGATAVLQHRLVTANDIENFFKDYRTQCRNRGPLEAHLRRMRYSINRFIKYLEHKDLFNQQLPAPVYQQLLDDYLQWLRHYQHVSDGTLKLRAHSISKFLKWFGPQATAQGLSKLTAEKIEHFFLSYAQAMGRARRRSMQSGLRTFLRFCFIQGYLPHCLQRAVPTLRSYKQSTVPRGLTEKMAQKVISSVDLSTDSGKRDYAILQLLYTYGVRGGQVRDLRMEDVRWADNQILFRALKNGKDSLMPLSVEVGKSLLDYIRYARPRCAYPYVFSTCRAPYHPLVYSSSLSAIVERHIRKAGINVPCKGAHVFRHGFATRMVNKGHSLKSVADVLGHRHISTTFIYTKIDFNALKQVALDWPEEVNS